MFIAHLPAGYLLAKTYISKVEAKKNRCDTTAVFTSVGIPERNKTRSFSPSEKMLSHPLWRRLFVVAALVGAIAPDFDLIWFFFVDNGSHHHHTYWTHYPLVWGVAVFFCGCCCRYSSAPLARVLWVFTACGLLHLVLDSIAGDIRWLAPISDIGFSLVTIPADYRVWWLNFLFHWTFLLEVAISGTALGWFFLTQIGRFQMSEPQGERT